MAFIQVPAIQHFFHYIYQVIARYILHIPVADDHVNFRRLAILPDSFNFPC